MRKFYSILSALILGLIIFFLTRLDLEYPLDSDPNYTHLIFAGIALVTLLGIQIMLRMEKIEEKRKELQNPAKDL